MTMRTLLPTSATLRSRLGIFALGLLSVALLNACGGGDTVTVPASTTTTTPVTATYVTSASSAAPVVMLPAASTVRYMIQGAVTSVEGVTTSYTQDRVGALTAIANSSLAPTDGTYAVQEYMGNGAYGQGRWTKGNPTVNGAAVTPVLSGTDSRAVHYLVTRDLSAFTDGTYLCGNATTSVATDLRSSGLTYSGTTDVVPSSPMLVGAVVPYAKITITGGVAKLDLTKIIVSGAGLLEEGYAATTVTFSSPTDMPKYLDFYGTNGGEGAAFVLGQDIDANNITLGMAYRRAMSNGARYQGMVNIVCRRS